MIQHPLTSLLKTVPTLPGIYEYISQTDEILYIGKAKNLRKRVTSYFQNYFDLTARIQIMIDNAAKLKFHVVSNEMEALLLEASLVKKHQPKYNILLKDDKAYSWIKISKDPYPIIYRTRNKEDKNAYYFGPFTSGYARDQIYNFLRKEFPFRTCSYVITPDDLIKREKRRESGERVTSRLCTYFHIKKCGGPCENKVSHEEYLRNIENIKKFLKNKNTRLIKNFESEMKEAVSKLQFEKAESLKQKIFSLKSFAEKSRINYGDDEDDVRILEYQKAKKGLEILIKTLELKDLKNTSKQEKADFLDNFRIECYDISNIQGSNAVGSMVVAVGGRMKKSHYRKFKINVKSTPDDFAMMEEMLRRRFKYLKPKNEIPDLENHNKQIKIKNIELKIENKKLKRSKPIDQDVSFASVPDLIIIDGGKGQLGVAVKVLKDLRLDKLKVCGLAKRREEIFVPGLKLSYLFDKKRETLFLLQRIRDEAHRFGITYHRLRRSKAMLGY